MTDRDHIKVSEEKIERVESQGGLCATCGKPFSDWGAVQLAHRIIKSKRNLDKYGPEVVHHKANTPATHPGRCNDAQIIENRPDVKRALINRILKELGR